MNASKDIAAMGAATGSGEVVAHRVMRKSPSGEWASDARDWSDGPPSKGLIESIRADNGRWRIDVAYAAPTTQPAPQQEVQEVQEPAPSAAGSPEFSVSQIVAITTAYEQGVGKGRQAYAAGKEILNPYKSSGYSCDLAWSYGYEEGKEQARQATQPAPASQGDALDVERLDWMDADGGRCVFHFGKTWYSRLDYGQPHRKYDNLRGAIDAARLTQASKK